MLGENFYSDCGEMLEQDVPSLEGFKAKSDGALSCLI